jgi:hypothetical protein
MGITKKQAGGADRHKFDKIKQHYSIGSVAASRMLRAQEIRRLAQEFVATLILIVGIRGNRAIEIIS